MRKFIDADRLKTEIGERDNQFRTGNYYLDNSEQAVGYQNALTDICGIIDSLQEEQPEVDLEKELENWRHKHFRGIRDGDYGGEFLARSTQLEIARRFYELGLNTRKEDEK